MLLTAALLLAVQARSPIEVPFELVSNRPYVELRVEGAGPFPFCVDTGNAQGTLHVDLGLARELGLELGELRRSHVGAGEGLEIETGPLPAVTFELGGQTMRALTPGAIDLGALARFDGRPTRGLLGRRFLERWLVELDYPAGRLRLHDRRAKVVLEDDARPPGSPRRHRIPFELEGGFIVVEAELTPHGHEAIPARFVVDTGARMTLVCHTPFVDAHGLLEATGASEPFPIGHGAGGECRGAVGRVAALRVADVELEDERVFLSRDRSGFLAGDHYDGILGGALLRRFRVFLDYGRRELVLEESALTGVEPPHDRSGLVLVADGPEGVRVLFVRPDMPGARAGLRAGDRLVALDGETVADLGLIAVREALSEPGAERRLALERDGKPVEATLRLDLEVR